MRLAVLHDQAAWMAPDAELAADLEQKRRLLAERRQQVVAERPESRPAQAEILRALVANLEAYHGALYERRGEHLQLRVSGETIAPVDPATAPLELAARLVQEDLCVMERRGACWRLSAGCVCFPTRWDLAPKLGCSLVELHAPVPGYNDQLSASTDRFFERLRPGRIVWRTNWSLVDSPELFLPPSHRRASADITARNAGERVWLRVERQTLRRFPETDAILFTIRVYRNPLRDLQGSPEAARDLLGALSTMAPELQRYKAIPPLRQATMDYLRGLCAMSEDAGAPPSRPSSR
jgi:hypothetical protein